MTEKRRDRTECDDQLAKVIPLRPSALSGDRPTSDLGALLQRAGTTFTELVATAEDYGLDVSEQARLAAVLLDVRLSATGVSRQVPVPASPPGTLDKAEEGLKWTDDLDSALAVLIELWRCNLDRRDFLSAMGALAVTRNAALRWLIAPRDDEAERETGSRRVALTDVEVVQATGQHLKAIDDARGGGAALPIAVNYLRREVAPLLHGRFTDAVGRSLFSATSQFTLGVGWMAYDAGKHGLAQRYMTQALRMSHAANNRALGGRVLAAMSHHALHLGEVRHGIDLACAARVGTEGAVTPTMTAMLAAMEACAYAEHGDATLCLKALSNAERALGHSNPADDPEWIDFDEGGLAGHFARCFRDLNRPQEAEDFAMRSIDICHPSHLRTRMQRYAILATARVQLGDLEGACMVGRRVLEEAPKLSSTRTLDDVTRLIHLVGANRTSRPVREFTEQAGELLKQGRRRPPAT